VNGVEQTIFDIAEALEIPVLVLAIAALAAVIFELGAFAIELYRRRGRRYSSLSNTTDRACQALSGGDRSQAGIVLSAGLARSAAMDETLQRMVALSGGERSDDELAKALADFDFRSMRRLERTRLLVRAGPALGLMGTLIPLSPALSGLADGDIDALSENLRVAFSVTVLGLLVGAVAFGVSLVRDRLYGQDLSDLEYVATRLQRSAPATPVAATSVAAP
jgi:biopolymer transport protein ExbB/TolQ